MTRLAEIVLGQLGDVALGKKQPPVGLPGGVFRYFFVTQEEAASLSVRV